ncbi:MAG: hypothetical protein AAFV29_05165 [Myxococcota bacterium]
MAGGEDEGWTDGRGGSSAAFTDAVDVFACSFAKRGNEAGCDATDDAWEAAWE